MKVHPRYHSSLNYVEPEIYGLAKYNIHYHELATIGNMLSYNLKVGNSILVKSFCGDLLSDVSNSIISIDEEQVVTFFPFNQTSNLTKLESDESYYTRAFVNVNSSKIKFADQGGMIKYTSLKSMLHQEHLSHLDSGLSTFEFFLDDNAYIDQISLKGDVNSTIEVSLENSNTSLIPSQVLEEDLFFYPSTPILLEKTNKLIFSSNSPTSNVMIKIQYFSDGI